MGRIKTLASDSFIYGISTILGRFLSFLLTPLYTNFLSKSDVGDVNNLYVFIGIIVVFYSLGMESAYFRFFKKDDLKHNKAVFSNSFIFMVSVSLLITLIWIFFSPNLSGYFFTLDNATELFILAAFIPVTDIITYVPYAYLRMTRHSKQFAITKLLIVIIVFLLNILFVTYFKTGISGIIWAQIIGNTIGVFLLFPVIFKNLLLKIDKQLIKEMLIFGLPTVPASISQLILQVSDRIVVSEYCGREILGLYSVNYKLGIPMLLFVNLFEYAWKPFYLTHYQDSDSKQLFSRIFTYFTLCCAVVFLVSSLFMSDLVQLPSIGGRLINPKYYEGMNIIPIILGAYYFSGVYNNFAVGIQISKKTKYFVYSLATAGIINIAMNIALIPIYGYQVAAWTTLLGYFISAILLYYFSHKVYPITYEWKRVLLLIALTISIYIISIQFISFEFSIINVLIKLIAILIFLLALKLLKFFTPQEINQIKKILPIKNKSKEIQNGNN